MSKHTEVPMIAPRNQVEVGPKFRDGPVRTFPHLLRISPLYPLLGLRAET
jgi:hypothetical protein